MMKNPFFFATLLIIVALLPCKKAFAESLENLERPLSPQTATPPSLKVAKINQQYYFVVIKQEGRGKTLEIDEELKVVRQGREIARAEVTKANNMYSIATLIEMDPDQPVALGDDIQRV